MSGDSMASFVTELIGSGNLNATTMWGEVSNAVPLIVGVATFSLGFYIIKKLIKGFGKGKVRI